MAIISNALLKPLLISALVLLTAGLLVTGAQAQADDDTDPDSIKIGDEDDADFGGSIGDGEEEEDYPAGGDGSTINTLGVEARAVFNSIPYGSPVVLPAGEKVSVLIAVSHTDKNAAAVPKADDDDEDGAVPDAKRQYTVLIANAQITVLNNPIGFIQNFSAVRSSRPVAAGETVAVGYEFTPDGMLEPQDYSLVVRAYFLDADNTTYVAVAFNGTITIVDPPGTDPKTVMTFCIIFCIASGLVYFLAKNKTVSRRFRSAGASSGASSKKAGGAAAAAAGNGTYDKTYVDPEHIKYREALIKAAADRTPSPKTAKPTKTAKK